MTLTLLLSTTELLRVVATEAVAEAVKLGVH
jgi:hypothetical protein